MAKSKKKRIGPMTRYRMAWTERQLAERDQWTVFNPNQLPISTLPVIYGYEIQVKWKLTFNGLISESGNSYAVEIYGRVDAPRCLGVVSGSRPDIDARLQADYPCGYRMEFVPSFGFEKHEGLMKAFELHGCRLAFAVLPALPTIANTAKAAPRTGYEERVAKAIHQVRSTLRESERNRCFQTHVRHEVGCPKQFGRGDCVCDPDIEIETPRGICTVDRDGNACLPSITN